MKDVDCGLDRCFLCRNVMPEWRKLIAGHKKTSFIKKGKSLFTMGQDVEGIYFLYSGIVKIHAPWTDGREMIIRFARGGEIAGHRGLSGNFKYPVSATALEDSIVCYIDNEFLELSLKANPSLTYTLMHFYATELQKAEKRMRDLIHMEAKGRISQALLELSDSYGTDEEGCLALKLTRQDLSAYAGTTYETVFKLFTEWAAAGIITTGGKDIRINQPDVLRGLVVK